MNSLLNKHVHFILVGTTHSGNIGAAARAMKTMGFESLRLVDPCPYKTSEAFARASGADGLVRDALSYSTLSDAIADCSLVFGTSARLRSLTWAGVDAREAAVTVAACPAGSNVAVVFGRERSGLTNSELDLCTHQLQIPTSEDFASLNLGSAVQVVAYELRMAHLGLVDGTEQPDADEPVADSESMEHFFAHLERTLIELDFLDPENPRLLMRRLRRYFGRNRPVATELNILRGILTAASAAGRDSPRG